MKYQLEQIVYIVHDPDEYQTGTIMRGVVTRITNIESAQDGETTRYMIETENEGRLSFEEELENVYKKPEAAIEALKAAFKDRKAKKEAEITKMYEDDMEKLEALEEDLL